MRTRFFGLVVLVALAGMVGLRAQAGADQAAAAPVVVLETVKGTIEFETFIKDAPVAVDHILQLVRRNFYRGLRFHWVQPGVIQIGDPLSRDMSKMDSWGLGGSGHWVKAVEISKRSFVRGSVGLFFLAGRDARASDSQIFILKAANPALDGKYIMIGRVTAGMAVVDKIEKPDMLRRAYVKGETPK